MNCHTHHYAENQKPNLLQL